MSSKKAKPRKKRAKKQQSSVRNVIYRLEVPVDYQPAYAVENEDLRSRVSVLQTRLVNFENEGALSLWIRSLKTLFGSLRRYKMGSAE